MILGSHSISCTCLSRLGVAMTSTSPPTLTTIFTPPPSCTTDTWMIENLSGTDYYTTTVTTGLTGWWLNLGPTDWSTCFPSGYAQATDFYYSPGICPSGYWTAFQSAYTSSGEAAETHATCCLINYSVQTRSNLLWFTTNQCTSRHTELSVWTYTQGGVVSSLTTTADGINAKGVSIRWRASDLITVTTTSSSQITTSTGIRGLTTTPTPTSTPQETHSSSSGLSTGAKAGIGVGVAVGALLIFAVIVLIWMLRRKGKKDDPSSDSIEPTYRNRYMPPTELEDNGAAYGYTEAKHGDSSKHSSKPKPLHELDSKHIAAELPAQ
ncbi:hypothetical protein N7471_010816 [Penicillium samsonianum]|uniref:uncharacterized protein n=1 Tax=Penicillium samsonianum TaxID=1882272 RepID=UPI00254684C3|nr:uncharacterized protein N7471_010816 [Penicillium samsonianum]KAJ6123499.1 hypothetical protein N7471_010816 [Penicillium samsonianum]